MLRRIFSVAVIAVVLMASLLSVHHVTAQRLERDNSDYERVLLGMGSNARGALGFLNHRHPYFVESLSNVTIRAWCASSRHAVAIANETNEIYTWGYNDKYQTGHGDALANVMEASQPLRFTNTSSLPDLSAYEWDQVLCSVENSIVRDSKAGVALVWGTNSKGTTGLENTQVIKTPELSFYFSAGADFFSTRDGQGVWKVNQTDDTLHAIGLNDFGQLGMEPVGSGIITSAQPLEVTSMYAGASKLSSDIAEIAGDESNSFFLLQNGELYSAGVNSLGSGYILKTELRLDGVSKFASSGSTSWAVMNSNEVIAFGSNTCGRVYPDLTITNIDGTNSTGTNKILTNNRVDTTALEGSIIEKVSISKTHVAVLTKDNKVFGLGCNSFGQITSDEVDHVLSLRQLDNIPSGEVIVDIIAVDSATLMLTEKGKLLAVGKSNVAGYGSGFDSATQIETPKKMDRAYAGNEGSFVFTPYDGEVFSFGKDLDIIAESNVTVTSRDQLTIAQTKDLVERNITEMALAGIGDGSHNVYALDGDRVHIYGSGNTLEGQLLCTEFDCDPKPDDPQWFFTTLPQNTTKFKMIDAGAVHFGGIASKISTPSEIGSYIWGRNVEGQAGYHGEHIAGNPIQQDDHVVLCTGDHHTVAISRDGHLFATGSNERGQIASEIFHDKVSTFQEIKLSYFGNQTVTNVFCGAQTTFAVVQNGDVYVFGDNTYGQLGLGEGKGDEIRSPTRNSVLSDINKNSATSLNPGILKISSANHGGAHTLVLTAQGELYGMGRNDLHQLGIPLSQANQYTPTKIETPIYAMKGGDSKVLDISAGFKHSLIIAGRKTCPNDCSNDIPRGITQGDCDVVVGQCACYSGYTGFDCSQRTCEDPLCSGSGTCDTTRGICNCLPGFSGLTCSYRRCANNCSGSGRCNRNTGVCLCDSGWTGADCSKSGAMGSHLNTNAGILVTLLVSLVMMLLF